LDELLRATEQPVGTAEVQGAQAQEAQLAAVADGPGAGGGAEEAPMADAAVAPPHPWLPAYAPPPLAAPLFTAEDVERARARQGLLLGPWPCSAGMAAASTPSVWVTPPGQSPGWPPMAGASGVWPEAWLPGGRLPAPPTAAAGGVAPPAWPPWAGWPWPGAPPQSAQMQVKEAEKVVLPPLPTHLEYGRWRFAAMANIVAAAGQDVAEFLEQVNNPTVPDEALVSSRAERYRAIDQKIFSALLSMCRGSTSEDATRIADLIELGAPMGAGRLALRVVDRYFARAGVRRRLHTLKDFTSMKAPNAETVVDYLINFDRLRAQLKGTKDEIGDGLACILLEGALSRLEG